MEPYQEASQEARRRNLSPQTALKSGVDLTSRMMPLLSQYVPPLLALKGLSKLNSGIGKFIGAATKTGQQPDQIVDFIRNKVSPKQEIQEQTQTEKSPGQQGANFIGQFSPELQEFIEEKLREGLSTDQASAIVRVDQKFSPLLAKIEKQANMKFSEILRHTYGDQRKQEQGQNQPQQTGSDWNQIMQMAQQFLG